MNQLRDNQGGLGWVIGLALGIGALVLLARPKKASASQATGPLPAPPPPISVDEQPMACVVNKTSLHTWGSANNVRIEVHTGDVLEYVGSLDPNSPVLAWYAGETVLRGQSHGPTDVLATKSYCAYALGQIPLQCSISGGANFTKFANWAFQKYKGQSVHVVEVEYPPPPISELQKTTLEGGITRVTALPGEIVTDANTLLVTRAPYEMVWRYYQGQPTQAPEVMAVYCQAVANGTVQGVRGTLGVVWQ